MLAFREEAHVDRWCEAREVPKGFVFSLEQAWGLGREWYSDNLSLEWRRRSREEAHEVFAGLGLTGDFWRLGEQ
jgi:Alkylmercury lyase